MVPEGALVAMVAGTKATDVVAALTKIPEKRRHTVTEVTLDMSNAMNVIVRASFPQASIVTDRFHVQQLVSEAVQDIRNKLRREALQEETAAILLAKQEKRLYQPNIYSNGDTKKQLLSRSFYLLFKSPVLGQHDKPNERLLYLLSFQNYSMRTTSPCCFELGMNAITPKSLPNGV